MIAVMTFTAVVADDITEINKTNSRFVDISPKYTTQDGRTIKRITTVETVEEVARAKKHNKNKTIKAKTSTIPENVKSKKRVKTKKFVKTKQPVKTTKPIVKKFVNTKKQIADKPKPNLEEPYSDVNANVVKQSISHMIKKEPIADKPKPQAIYNDINTNVVRKSIFNTIPSHTETPLPTQPTPPKEIIENIADVNMPTIETLAPVFVEGTSVVSLDKKKFRFGDIKNDNIQKTEVISEAQIGRSGANNFADAMKNLPGVDKQIECSICGASGITLGNLPARFTSVMIDGIPLYSSFGGVYGFDLINMSSVNSVEITKGAGASGMYPDALAGIVNVITKKPTKTTVSANIEAGDYAHRSGNFYIGTPTENKDIAIAFFGGFDKRNQVSTRGDGVTTAPSYDRSSFGINIFHDAFLGAKIKLGYDHSTDTRFGGAVGDNVSELISNTSGNPFNFTKTHNGSPVAGSWLLPNGNASNPADYVSYTSGGVVNWNAGSAALLESITTTRDTVRMSATKTIMDIETNFSTGYAHQTQASYYEGINYGADQNLLFSQLTGKKAINDIHTATVGLNYRYDDLRSQSSYTNPTSVFFLTQPTMITGVNNGFDNYTYNNLGLIGNLNSKFFVYGQDVQTDASLRLDAHNHFKTQFAPRFSALINHNPLLASRFYTGIAYRYPTTFFETEHNTLYARTLNRDIHRPESAFNLGYNLAYTQSDRWRMNGGYNMTMFDGLVVTNMSTDGSILTFQNISQNRKNMFAFNDATVHTFDFTTSYDVTPNNIVSFGAEHNIFKYKQSGTALAFMARPNDKLYLSYDHDNDLFEFFTKATLWGQQDLAKFYGSDRYNLDGTQKRAKSPAFLMVDYKLTIKITKNIKIYQGINNIFDYQQVNKDSYLFYYAQNPTQLQTTNIWGPGIGRYMYAGVKFDF